MVLLLILLSGVIILFICWLYVNRPYFIEGVPIWKDKEFQYIPYLGHSLLVKHLANTGIGQYYFMNACKQMNYEPYQLNMPFGTTFFFTCKPQHLKNLFSKENFQYFNKGKVFFEVFEELLGRGIFAVDGDQWRSKRKVSSYLFSARSLRDHMAHTFRKHAFRVVERLNSVAKGDIIDIQQLFQCYTFDSIATIAFGMNVDSLRGNEKDVKLQYAYDEAQSICTTRFFRLGWKIERFFGMGKERILSKHIKLINKYVFNVVDERLKSIANGESGKGDMLSLYIADGLKNKKTYNRQYLRDMILNFLIAGR